MRSVTVEIEDKGDKPFGDEVIRHLRNIANAIAGHPDYEKEDLEPKEFYLYYYLDGQSRVTGKVTIR